MTDSDVGRFAILRPIMTRMGKPAFGPLLPFSRISGILLRHELKSTALFHERISLILTNSITSTQSQSFASDESRPDPTLNRPIRSISIDPNQTPPVRLRLRSAA